MLSMSNEILEAKEINAVIQSGITDDEYEKIEKSSFEDSKAIPETGTDTTKLTERRADKSERRVNDNYDYRGPARRFDLDRRE